MTEPNPERRPPPEPEKFVRRLGLQSRLMLTATNFPNNLNVINPNKKDIAAFEKDKIGDFGSHNYALFNRASTRERQKSASVSQAELPRAVQSWGDKAAKILKNDKRAKNLQRILDEDPTKIKGSRLIELIHKQYFAGKEDPDMHAFVKDVVEKYREGDETNRGLNVEALNKDMDSILWFSGLFGAKSKEVVAQLIDAEVQRELDPNGYAQQASANVNDIDDQKTQEILKFLSQSVESVMQSGQTPEPEPTEPPEPMKPSSEQKEFDPDKTQTLQEYFQQVHSEKPLDPSNQYFVETVPDRLELNEEQLKSLEIRLPFFEITQAEKGVIVSPNIKVVPYVHEFSAQGDHPQQRYVDAEFATQNDSGLLALSAIAAENPEKQAQLYKLLSELVLQVHEKNPQLLNDWLKNQGGDFADENDHVLNSSLKIFHLNDLRRVAAAIDKGKTPPITDLEKLVFEGPDGIVDNALTTTTWQNRIKELKIALETNKIQPHHLRWIEFLNHSVDVSKLINTIEPNQEIEKPIDIKILSAENKDKLIEITEQDFEQPTVIRVKPDQIPPPAEVNVKLIPFLEELKLKDYFQTWKKDGDQEFTDAVELPGLAANGERYFYQALKKPSEGGTATDYTCILLRVEGEQIDAVGHVDFRKPNDSPEANSSRNLIDSLVGDDADFVEKWRGTEEAVFIDKKHQGKGLGKSLWYLALSHANLEGIEEVNVIGDKTEGQNPDRPGESFYRNLGAEPVVLFQNDADGVTIQALHTPTYLLTAQRNELTKLFTQPASPTPEDEPKD